MLNINKARADAIFKIVDDLAEIYAHEDLAEWIESHGLLEEMVSALKEAFNFLEVSGAYEEGAIEELQKKLDLLLTEPVDFSAAAYQIWRRFYQLHSNCCWLNAKNRQLNVFGRWQIRQVYYYMLAYGGPQAIVEFLMDRQPEQKGSK